MVLSLKDILYVRVNAEAIHPEMGITASRKSEASSKYHRYPGNGQHCWVQTKGRGYIHIREYEKDV